MALTIKVLVLTVAAFVVANLAIYLYTVAFAQDDDPTMMVQPTPMKGGAIEGPEQALQDSTAFATAEPAAEEE